MEMLDSMFGIEVHAAYGMTETVTHATYGRPSERLPERSMGHVSPGYEFAVVDKDTGELCAEGETGELWLRGTRGIQLFLEYYDNPEANEKAFDGDWFKTGDMVMLGTGGNLFYRERDKDLLKVGRRERVGPRGRGGHRHRRRGRPRSRWSASPTSSSPRSWWPSSSPRRAPPTTPRSRPRSSRPASDRLADFKVPRAVYVVDEFPTGTLDKLLKNKLPRDGRRAVAPSEANRVRAPVGWRRPHRATAERRRRRRADHPRGRRRRRAGSGR